MTTTQPPLFPMPEPQPVSTEALLRRLAELEAHDAEYPHDYAAECSPCRWHIRAKSSIVAELWSRGVGL